MTLYVNYFMLFSSHCSALPANRYGVLCKERVTFSSYMIGCVNNGNDLHIYFFLISILIEIENQLSLSAYYITSSMVVKGFLIVIVLINIKLASAASATYRKQNIFI